MFHPRNSLLTRAVRFPLLSLMHFLQLKVEKIPSLKTPNGVLALGDEKKGILFFMLHLSDVFNANSQPQFYEDLEEK